MNVSHSGDIWIGVWVVQTPLLKAVEEDMVEVAKMLLAKRNVIVDPTEPHQSIWYALSSLEIRILWNQFVKPI